MYLSLAAAVFFVGLLVLVRPFLSVRMTEFFVHVLAVLVWALVLGSLVVTWWAR